MDTTSWVRRVASAPSHDEVITLVRQYIATRDQSTLSALPPECGATTLSTVQEVHDCAYRLASHSGYDDVARIVQRVSTFFAQASIRLAELTHRPPPTQP
jgi:hypothetical protein